MKKIKLKFMLVFGVYFLSLTITAIIDNKYGTNFESLVLSAFVGFFSVGWYNCEKELQHKKVKAKFFTRTVCDFKDFMDWLFKQFDKPKLHEDQIYLFYEQTGEKLYYKYMDLKYVRDGYSFYFNLNSGLDKKPISTVDVKKDNLPNGIYCYFDEKSGYILVNNI